MAGVKRTKAFKPPFRDCHPLDGTIGRNVTRRDLRVEHEDRGRHTRMQRLYTLRDEYGEDYDVIVRIVGCSFKLRREDMRW